uniref:hypothetical protein n=1 Tax=Flavobacterium sp. TaxID=239 RepID=UPI0037531535
GIAFFFRSLNDNSDGKWLLVFFMFIVLIWTFWRFKIFIINQNELIIRRFFFTSKFDKSYKFNQIRQVNFTFMTGKFGGNKIIVYSIFVNDYKIYSINLKSSEIKEFITVLENHNIKVVNKLKF